MDSLRKRRHDAPSGPEPSQASPQVPPMLERLRNMWQFSNLCQWFYIFGGVVKLDNLDIDELEMQCLSPHSQALQDIGLALLKYLSSHRGLTNELFDEYTRRQFISKAPELPNPFGNDEVPAKFSSFTVFQRIRILYQMTSFIMMNPEKLREKMAEQKDADHDQTTWRIEPFGWDRDDRVYFVLDDNRVYRLTEALPPPPKPKKNTKKARAQARRNGKRRRVSSSALDNAIDGAEDDDEKFADGQPQAEAADAIAEEDIDDGLGGMKWECVAVTLDDLRKLLSSISSKKDPNERVLHDKIAEHLLPILEQQEEKRKRREKEREKELLNLAKMASAKRSSRIAGRQEQQRQEEIIREEEQKRRLEMEAQRKEEQKQRKIEKEREARLLTREKRLHEREVRRAQHEDELAHLSEDNKALENAAGRMSERRRQAEIEKNKEALRELEEEGEEEEWTFDCICGLHGKIDDGQHSVACEKCNIWQHSKCLNIDEHEAEKDDFHFICNPCKRKAAAAANGHPNGRPIIRIKVNKSAAAAETATKAATEAAAKTTSETPLNPLPFSINIPSVPPSEPPAPKSVAPSLPESIPELSTGVKAESNSVGGPSAVPHLPGPPASNNGISRIPVKTDGSASLPILISAGKPSLGPTTGSASPAPGPLHDTLATSLLSLPRPDLPQPDQSPRRSHAYGTIHEQPTPVPDSGPSPRAVPQLFSPTPVAATPASNMPAVFFQKTPNSLTTPRLHHPQGDGRAVNKAELSSSPLPSHGGLSPTKSSPTIAKDQASMPHGNTLTPSILPPTAALSPSTPKQILSPPVKPEGLAHRQSFSSMPTDLIPQPRDSESRTTD